MVRKRIRPPDQTSSRRLPRSWPLRPGLQVMPTSTSPGGRANFGCWQSGFQLYVSGGEGASSTLQDTWVYNFYTRVSPPSPRLSFRPLLLLDFYMLPRNIRWEPVVFLTGTRALHLCPRF